VFDRLASVEAPETRYARAADGSHIAYQVLGEGPIDLVVVPGFVSHIEVIWEWPPLARNLHRLATFSRVVLFDPRGRGLSTKAGVPTLRDHIEDLGSVMDEVGSKRAAIVGQNEGGPTSIAFAAAHPGRVSTLVLLSSFARFTPAPDYPWGPSPVYNAALGVLEQVWGQGHVLASLFPELADDRGFRQFAAKLERFSGSPGEVLAVMQLLADTDVRQSLGALDVPTLVLHRADDPNIDVGHARYLASRIRGARLVELAGRFAGGPFSDAFEEIEEIEEFLTGDRHTLEPDRVLATVLFTDIVGSTERAGELGDRRWRDLLDAHHEMVRRQLRRFRGREVKMTGDGVLATFDSPTRAIRCACAIRNGLRPLGVELRAGLHTGEVEVIGDDVGGIAVHIGARVSAMAEADDVLVSGAVPSLVVGSGIEFVDRGEHELKGVPGSWRRFAVENG